MKQLHKIHTLTKGNILLVLLVLLSCSKSDDDPTATLDGGNILVEYSHNINSLEETRHTFTDGGRKFDKVLNQIDEVLTEFIYQGDNLTEVIMQVDDGTDRYVYAYSGNNISSLTIEETRNGTTESRTWQVIHDSNALTWITPDDPPNLFRKKYTLTGAGKVTRCESFRRTGSDSYDYDEQVYEYDNQGRVDSFRFNTGIYIPSSETYDVFFDRYIGGWDYFDNVSSPFQNITRPSYYVMLLTPEAFNDGIFAKGSLGLLENDFVTHYWLVDTDLNRPVEWEEVRTQNITIQNNRLPRSGNVMFGFRPFEFTYAE
ncbi:MAG: hypothetical protein AAF466_04755 [Bacteroidota bacterium]